MNNIRVLIVDDSITMQRLLKRLLNYDNSIDVIGVANDPYMARELIKIHNPDVLLLDIEMPNMDGITFLKNIMRLRPMPVIMVSSYTEPGKAISLDALAAGAIDCISKPTLAELAKPHLYAHRLIKLIKNASQVNLKAFTMLSKQADSLAGHEKTNVTINTEEHAFLTNNIYAIGASTGGIEIVEKIITNLPAKTPGIVIVQHISRDISDLFAQRINKSSKLTVMLAKAGQKILPGYALIAPHNSHLIIKRQQDHFICEFDDSEYVQGHKPSVDKLFFSLAATVGVKATAILLTGMGRDGAQGLKAVYEAGGTTIAQDKQSSIVWGMPGEAVKIGAAQHVMSVMQIIDYLTTRI